MKDFNWSDILANARAIWSPNITLAHQGRKTVVYGDTDKTISKMKTKDEKTHE